VDNPEVITVLSLCSGYGGLELGLSLALENPMRIIAVEIEAFALANLAAKAEAGKVAVEAMWPDLRTFPAERFRGCFDFVLAGYPCQPFSVAGTRKGAADERYLWPVIAHIVREIRPVWCFLENVAGHLQIGFDSVVRDLDAMGYRVEAGLFTAAEVGAPHKRQRLFVLAYTVERAVSARATQAECCLQKWPILQEKFNHGPGIRSNAGSCLRTLWPPRPDKVADIPRAIDGTPCPVDRLRLLGNGVVPQQAAKAFGMLYEKCRAADRPERTI
jgi:site-specific DNA-cytosine methylase